MASQPDPNHDSPAPGNTSGSASAAPNEAPVEGRCREALSYDLVLERAGRRLSFRVRSGQEREVLDRLAAMADDPDDPLTWYDAALLCDQVGQALSHRLGRLDPLKPRPKTHYPDTPAA